MNATDTISVIAVIMLMLQNATQIPRALAALLRACLPVVRSAHHLVAAIKSLAELPAQTQRAENDDMS
ncbi:hypothetical protein [Nocardia salmonicida]|uniref:hypothetical protein n=1 Tax=Nocardia salmonicida TaxID=53431 RepID=UPI0007A3A736|nr:hypothetical protein [Nocardia salmonicida]